MENPSFEGSGLVGEKIDSRLVSEQMQHAGERLLLIGGEFRRCIGRVERWQVSLLEGGLLIEPGEFPGDLFGWENMIDHACRNGVLGHL